MAAKSTRVVILISAVILARILLFAVVNPMDAVRADLAMEVAQASGDTVPVGGGSDYASLQNDIAARPSLWSELVEAPPAAPEAPINAVQVKKPDLAAMLKGVKIDRGQIGENKIRVITPETPKGQWVVVGTVIKGCTLASFNADGVTFTYHWKEGGQDLRLTLPRP